MAVTCDLLVCRSSQHSRVLTSLGRRGPGLWVDEGLVYNKMIKKIIMVFPCWFYEHADGVNLNIIKGRYCDVSTMKRFLT